MRLILKLLPILSVVFSSLTICYVIYYILPKFKDGMSEDTVYPVLTNLLIEHPALFVVIHLLICLLILFSLISNKVKNEMKTAILSIGLILQTIYCFVFATAFAAGIWVIRMH